jgi:hypothetical protein
MPEEGEGRPLDNVLLIGYLAQTSILDETDIFIKFLLSISISHGYDKLIVLVRDISMKMHLYRWIVAMQDGIGAFYEVF